MAFCMSGRSHKLGQTGQNQSKRQSKSIIGKPPSGNSPLLQTIQQTRFSKKDIKDLKSRFEKNSTWVLVDEKGETIDLDLRNSDNQEQAIMGKQIQHDYQEKGSNRSDNLQTFQKTLKSSHQSISPNTSLTMERNQTPIRQSIFKGGNYKKIEISLEKDHPNLGIHYERKMSKQQFRLCMGLLGLESNAFLSDRIFEVVDSDNDQFISFAQFATIMDTLINGEEDEKHEFSFSLLDIYDAGYLGFDEFTEIITKIIAHWCIITGSQVKVEKEGLRQIFNKMDANQDGIVDVEEYKKALKGNPQLFQWFDLLNQGVQDGYTTQKNIMEVKINALSDVLALQQKLSKVMNQMQQIEINNNNNNNNDYLSSKQSSSEMSNFGSAFSKQKRESFKIDEFNKSLERNIIDNNEVLRKRKLSQTNQNQLFMQTQKSQNQETSKSNKFKNQLQLLLEKVDQDSPRFNEYQTFNNLPTDTQRDSALGSLQDQYINQMPKKAMKIDSQEYQIMEFQKRQEIQKQRKKEFGEKKPPTHQMKSKGQIEQDADVIEDPDSPGPQKSINTSNNIKNKKSQNLKPSQRKTVEHPIQSHQQFHPIQRAQQSIIVNSNRNFSPLIHQTRTESQITENDRFKVYSSKHDQQTPTISQTLRQNSNNSANSQMKPEYQQSSMVNSGKTNLNQIQSRNKNSLQMQSHTQRQSSQIPNYFGQLNAPQLNPNGYNSDWSPTNGQDGIRSEINHAQGGGPVNTSQIIRNSNDLVLSEINQSRILKSKTKKSNSHIGEIFDQHSQAYQMKLENDQLKSQQHKIMKQLNDMQGLANNLMKQLQEDKDSAIGEQIKEYVEKQKKKIQQNDGDSDSDISEQEKELQRISLNLDDGNLRPVNQIQNFFKVRSRQRLTESIKKSSHIHKPLSKSQSKSFIHIGHDNWNLVLHMMLGIRQSVRNVMHEEVFELMEQDFQRKYSYELISKKTKNMNLFEFFDFSPRVFHLIRTMYGITPDQYLKSLGLENLIGNLLMGNISSLKEQCSTGKSGSFFYYTADSNFMLKTISNGEFHNLRVILKDYYDHLALYPHTLITRFFGLHKIKYQKQNGGKARIYFVIMANVFKTTRDINYRFDLKGSTQGRKTRKHPNDFIDSSVALKDLDFLDENFKIKVSPDIQNALKQQMKDDVALFQRLNINDYSLLLGIHKLQDEDEGREILQNSPSIHQIIRNSYDVLKNKESGKRIGVTYNSQKLLRPPIPFYEAHDGGIVSSDGKYVYFIGIIDTLTFFGAKKKLEYSLKSVAYGNKTISCIPPKNYGDRFISFMNNIFE